MWSESDSVQTEAISLSSITESVITWSEEESINGSLSLSLPVVLDSSSVSTTVASDFSTQDRWWLNFFPQAYLDPTLTLGDFLFRVFGVVICSLLIVCTLFGNILTVLVVKRFHRMKTVTNILLASLAIADITVALLVMPLTIVYDYLRQWPFGAFFCHFFISCDVMCCTASIQHLCAVAIDRYWAITSPLRYRTSVNKRRLFVSICVIWLNSAAISFIPIFSGMYHDGSVTEIFSMADQPSCSLKVNRVYATVSSLISFYLPLPIMFYVYMRILLIAERQSREIKQLQQSLRLNGYSSAGGNGGGPITKTLSNFGGGSDSVKQRDMKAAQIELERAAAVLNNNRPQQTNLNNKVKQTTNAHNPRLTMEHLPNCKSLLSSQTQLITSNVIERRSASCSGCTCGAAVAERLAVSVSSADRLPACCATSTSCCTLAPMGTPLRKCSDSSTTSGSCSSAAVRCSLQVGLHGGGLAQVLISAGGADGSAISALNDVFADVSETNTSLSGSGVIHAPHCIRQTSAPSVLDELRRAERQLRKRSKQILTDTKAIRTLGIVMGVFVACWLPFFIMYLLNAYAEQLQFSYELRSAITWMGYLNSVANPCIYAMNKEFKQAFKRVLHCAPRILVQGASRRAGEEPSFAGGIAGRFGGTIIGDPASVSGTACTLGALNTSTSGGRKRSEKGLRFGFGVRRARLLGGRSSAHSLGTSCNMQDLSSSGASHSYTKDMYDSLDGQPKEWTSNRVDSIGGMSLGCSMGVETDLDGKERLNLMASSEDVCSETRKKSLEKLSTITVEEKAGKTIPLTDIQQHSLAARRSSIPSRTILPMNVCEEDELFEVEEEGLTAQHVAENVAGELQMQSPDGSLRGVCRAVSATGSGNKTKAERAAERRRQRIASQTRFGIRLARLLDGGRLRRRKNCNGSTSGFKRKKSDAKLI